MKWKFKKVICNLGWSYFRNALMVELKSVESDQVEIAITGYFQDPYLHKETAISRGRKRWERVTIFLNKLFFLLISDL